MKITDDFGNSYEAEIVRVAMTKTLLVEVYVDVDWLIDNEVSEKMVVQVAHEKWLDVWDKILDVFGEHSGVDVEIWTDGHGPMIERVE
jgi:hypothetical protein